MLIHTKQCLECGEPAHGRSDKKFCSDECRNLYHNRMRGFENSFMRAVNKVLLRNRRILMECRSEARAARVPVYTLQSRGFDFSYYTHCRPDRKGNEIIFCYDYGYQRTGSSEVRICMKMK